VVSTQSTTRYKKGIFFFFFFFTCSVCLLTREIRALFTSAPPARAQHSRQQPAVALPSFRAAVFRRSARTGAQPPPSSTCILSEHVLHLLPGARARCLSTMTLILLCTHCRMCFLTPRSCHRQGRNQDRQHTRPPCCDSARRRNTRRRRCLVGHRALQTAGTRG
jgi:hypothetical protein